VKKHIPLGRFALSLALAASCAHEHHGIDPDSETHFLRQCSNQNQCGTGTTCICGVCTRVCSQPNDCASSAKTALCAASSEPACSMRRVCDVLCSDDVDCRPLSGKHVCVDGRCRASRSAPPDASATDAQVDTGTAPLDAGPAFDAAPDGAPGDAAEAGAMDARPLDSGPPAKAEPCQKSSECNAGWVCSQQSCQKDPCLEASCAMIPLAPSGDATCTPATSTRNPCGSGRTCAASLVCHIDNTCIEPGACDQDGVATMLDSTAIYSDLDAIDDHYLYGTATRSGQPTILRWSTKDAGETVIAQGRDAAPQNMYGGQGRAIVDAQQLYWVGPKQTLDGTTLLWRVVKDGSAKPESAGTAGALLAQDEGYLYLSDPDQILLYRVRKDTPDARELIYTAPSGTSLTQVAVNNSSVFVDEYDGNGHNAVRMLDKRTLEASLLPIDTEGVLTPTDEYLYVVGGFAYGAQRYNFASGKAVNLLIQADDAAELTPLASRIIALEMPHATSSLSVSSMDPVTGVFTPLTMFPGSTTASSHGLVSTTTLFAENVDNRMLKFMLPPP
jgi:hypothetical protein